MEVFSGPSHLGDQAPYDLLESLTRQIPSGCIALRYTICMPQLVTRISDELMKSLDDLVNEGEIGSRSEAVRIALVALIDRHSRSRVGKEIVDGYLRHPQDGHDLGWADTSTIQMIAEEPW